MRIGDQGLSTLFVSRAEWSRLHMIIEHCDFLEANIPAKVLEFVINFVLLFTRRQSH